MNILRALLVVALASQLAACRRHRMQDMQGMHVQSFDDVSIVYDMKGEGEPTLVFIHGWCCNRGQWENQVPEFAQDHRVVALDLAGHGDSGNNRAAWTIPDYARDVEAVVTHLDLDDVILVGHSMGGPVALIAAARMPDRVIGVIGVDTLQDAEFEFPPGMIEQFAGMFEADFEGAMEQFFDNMYPKDEPHNRDVADRLMRDAMENDPQMAADLMRQFGVLESRKIFAACPVAIYCINDDAPNQTFAERNRKYNPRFHVVEMHDISHWPHLEKPAAFNALLHEQIEAIENGKGL